jgi:FdhD protein
VRTAPASVTEVRGEGPRSTEDLLAVEAPLELRVRAGGQERTLCITMRTPGDDAELAAGFLFTEGLVRARAELGEISEQGETVVVNLVGRELPEETAARPFAVTSACGVCGKGQLADLRATPAARPGSGPRLHPALIHRLPAALRAAQDAFAATGGLHAAGLFDGGGARLLVREDVGRHNAVDKLIGARFLAGRLPAPDTVLVVSGRASFELVQKALMAQIPVLAAVGAPSSLAVSLAAEGGMTLLGFVRDQRFNVYCGRERVQLDGATDRELGSPEPRTDRAEPPQDLSR